VVIGAARRGRSEVNADWFGRGEIRPDGGQRAALGIDGVDAHRVRVLSGGEQPAAVRADREMARIRWHRDMAARGEAPAGGVAGEERERIVAPVRGVDEAAVGAHCDLGGLREAGEPRGGEGRHRFDQG